MVSRECIKKLNDMNVEYQLIEHDEITCVEDGIKVLDVDIHAVLKTIGFSCDEGYIFVVLQGHCRLDYKKLETVSGIKRNKLKKIDPYILENELGYQAGGLSPIHLREDIKVFVDDAVQSLQYVLCGIGTRNQTLKIQSKDLIDVSEAILVNIRKE